MCGNHLRGQDPQEHMIESFQSPAILSKGIRVSDASVSQWVVTHSGFAHIVCFLFCSRGKTTIIQQEIQGWK